MLTSFTTFIPQQCTLYLSLVIFTIVLRNGLNVTAPEQVPGNEALF